VVRWWGQPDEQYALVAGDLDHPDMDQYIVATGDHPFGYISAIGSAPGTRVLGRIPAGRAASTSSSASPI
jgi:aminoglycoside 6'-N-acetyltransferase